MIRVMQLLPADATSEYSAARKEQLQRTLAAARVDCEVRIVRETSQRSMSGNFCMDDVLGASAAATADETVARDAAQPTRNAAVDALERECSNVNSILRLNSSNTAVAFVTLPLLPNSGSGAEAEGRYAASVAKLTSGLPPTFLMANGQGHAVITTDI